jgi:hypothetical protein
MKAMFWLLLTLLFGNQAAAQMTCAAPSLHVVDTNTTKAVASGDPSRIQNTVVDLIQRYPNADRVLLQRDLISSVCELVKNSPNADFNSKAKLLIDLTKQIQSAFEKASVSLELNADGINVLSSLAAPEIDYYVVMVSEPIVYTRCSVSNASVEYGDGVKSRKFVLYDTQALKAAPFAVNGAPASSGNFVLRLPRSLFFSSVDAARAWIAYFGRLPNANCYEADIELHVGLWTKVDGRYIAVYLMRSFTGMGECRISIENETPEEFHEIVGRYAAFRKRELGKIERDHIFAATADASSSIDEATNRLRPVASDSTATLSVEVDAKYPLCMQRSLLEAVRR